MAERYAPHRLAEIAGLCQVNPCFVLGYALRAACFVPPANSQCEMGGGDARGSLAACRASTGADRQ